VDETVQNREKIRLTLQR